MALAIVVSVVQPVLLDREVGAGNSGRTILVMEWGARTEVLSLQDSDNREVRFLVGLTLFSNIIGRRSVKSLYVANGPRAAKIPATLLSNTALAVQSALWSKVPSYTSTISD